MVATIYHDLQRLMNTIEIRLAKMEDAQCIALLGRITFTETFGHFFRDQKDLIDYYNLTFSVQKIENGLNKPNNMFWIAFVNRLPVGYAKLKLHSGSEFIKSKDVCQLQKIYVLKDFLSMKIGFELQDSLLKKAKELNFNTIWLSVLNSNERAIHFYKKTGFEKIGNHDFQIGKENFEFIAMKKTLQHSS
ncbi:MAG: GNAT family N-acetyltransferase [Chitinophagales bacterium]